jgi:broad specificity phosphatase PhoE
MPRLSHTDWPRRLWIVRHGQSAGNVARDAAERDRIDVIDIAVRDADAPLSALGAEQSRALAEWFARLPEEERPTVVLTSPFVRSVQTATIVADRLGIGRDDLVVDERLREKEFGVLDRYTVQGIRNKFTELAEQRQRVGKFYFRPPGGESWCDVILRMRSVVEVLRRDHVDGRVLIVAHQVIVNCMRYLLECLDEAKILAIDREGDVPNCGVCEYGLVARDGVTTFQLLHANLVPQLLTSDAAVTVAPDQPAGPR